MYLCIPVLFLELADWNDMPCTVWRALTCLAGFLYSC
jgi:hypothetical protein